MRTLGLEDQSTSDVYAGLGRPKFPIVKVALLPWHSFVGSDPFGAKGITIQPRQATSIARIQRAYRHV